MVSRYLQQLVRAQASRNRELESQLSQYRGPDEAHSDATSSLGLGSFPGMDGNIGTVDLGGLLTIPDEDGDDTEMSLGAASLNGEIGSQILAALEANQEHAPTMGSNAGESPSLDGMDEEDEDAGGSIGDESERGRQTNRRGRFGYPSQSVGKSAKVEEVDES